MKSKYQNYKLILPILLPFIGINQLTHWLFPLLSITLLLFFSKSKLHLPKTFINIAIVYCFWILMTGLISGDFHNPLRKLSETLILITWSVLIINMFLKQKDNMIEMIFYTGIIISVYLFMNLEGYIINFDNLIFGKNGIALFLITSLIFGLGIKKNRIKYIGLLLISIVLIFTFSLKNILALIIILLYRQRKFFKKKISIIVVFSLIIFITSYIKEIDFFLRNQKAYIFAISKIQAYLGLKPELSFASDYEIFRKNLISEGMELFYNNPLLGIGLENSRLVLSTYTHNHYVELLAGLGIFGFCIFNLFLIPFFKFNFRSINFGLIVFLIFIGLGWANKLYDNYSFFLLLSFGWSSLISKQQNHIFYYNQSLVSYKKPLNN